MNYKERLHADLVLAMKAKTPDKLNVIKMIKSKIIEAEKVDGIEVTDDKILKILLKLQRERQEGIITATKANRLDLASKEQIELDIVNEYLPNLMSPDEIKTVLIDIRNTFNPKDSSLIGFLMKEFNLKYAGKAETKMVSEIAKTVL